MFSLVFLRYDETDWFSKQVRFWNKLIVGKEPIAVHCGFYRDAQFYHSTIDGLCQEDWTKQHQDRVVYQIIVPDECFYSIRTLFLTDYRIHKWRDIPLWILKHKSVSCVTFCAYVMGFQYMRFVTPDEFMDDVKLFLGD